MKRALIVVDVQNDFCEGGSLAVAGGADVAGRIANVIATQAQHYAVVVGTRDWHVDPGEHFAQTPPGPDFATTWPAHCVAGSRGAESHPALTAAIAGGGIDAWFHKGAYAAAYSGFEAGLWDGREPGVPLADWLHAKKVTAVDVVGIATDYCVRATILDARKQRFGTRALLDLTAGISADSVAAAISEFRESGAVVTGVPVLGG